MSVAVPTGIAYQRDTRYQTPPLIPDTREITLSHKHLYPNMKSKSNTVTKPLKHDVHPGSRYEANINPGNKFYKQQLKSKKDKYRRAMDSDSQDNREVRRTLARQVYHEVTKIRNGRKGRFLGYTSSTRDNKTYVVMSEADALQKIHKDFKKLAKSKSTSRTVKTRDVSQSHDHVSAQEMAHLAREIANKTVEESLQSQVKYIKGKKIRST